MLQGKQVIALILVHTTQTKLASRVPTQNNAEKSYTTTS